MARSHPLCTVRVAPAYTWAITQITLSCIAGSNIRAVPGDGRREGQIRRC
jgi:hypothetical protein